MVTKNQPIAPSSDASIISIAELLNSSSITSSKLARSKNYIPWSSVVKTFLISNERLKYIEKDKPQVRSSVWTKTEAQVRSWLLNSMEPHVSCDVMLLPTAYAVWISVKETYGLEGNIRRMYELCEDIFLTKHGPRLLHEHHSFLKSKWEELNLYQPCPGDLTTWKRQREEMKVISVLAALGPQYESAKNQILSCVDLPILNATFSRLSRISVESEQAQDHDGGVALTATSHPNFSTARGRGRRRDPSGRGGGRLIGKKEERQLYFLSKAGAHRR